MCTAATYKTKDFYFGRTLDYEFSYGEEIVITPRNFPLPFRHLPEIKRHYAIIGVAHVAGNTALYYDAINEKGLGMAGLNFVGNADYKMPADGVDNVASFEFIPWVLSQCGGIQEVRQLLSQMNLVNTAFNNALPASQLHWIIADKDSAITVESVKDGLRVYDNPAGVLTNNPTFPEQMLNLNNYMHLSTKAPENHFSNKLPLYAHSRGMGALGLPGDLSSQSRFVRVAFVKLNSVSADSDAESISQFFHILGAVDQQRGCCEVSDGKFEYTIYTSCCNASKGVYYYTTYDNHQITGVDMYKENLDGNTLICYPLITGEQIRLQNEEKSK